MKIIPLPIPNPLNTIYDYAKIVEYVRSDQEKEGREAGIKAASEIYAPVLQKMEKKREKIIEEIKKEQESFEEKAKHIMDEYNKCENETTNEIKLIDSMRGQSPNMDTLITSLGKNGLYATICSPLIENFMCIISIGYFLEKKMDAKRKEFFKMELESKSKVWEAKIERERIDLLKSIDELNKCKDCNKDRLEKIKKLMKDMMSNYCEKTAQHNFLMTIPPHL